MGRCGGPYTSGFIEERVGELNAFTAEETTCFHAEFDVEEGTDPSVDVREACGRFAALFVGPSGGGRTRA